MSPLPPDADQTESASDLQRFHGFRHRQQQRERAHLARTEIAPAPLFVHVPADRAKAIELLGADDLEAGRLQLRMQLRLRVATTMAERFIRRAVERRIGRNQHDGVAAWFEQIVIRAQDVLVSFKVTMQVETDDRVEALWRERGVRGRVGQVEQLRAYVLQMSEAPVGHLD